MNRRRQHTRTIGAGSGEWKRTECLLPAPQAWGGGTKRSEVTEGFLTRRHRRPDKNPSTASQSPSPSPKQAMGRRLGSGIERGDESPGEPVLASPRQVRVGTWPLRFRTLASASARRTSKMVGCILAAPVRHRSGPACAVPSFVDPGLVPVRAAPKRQTPGAWALPGISESTEVAWNPWSESRTDPLEARLSPDYRAAVSLGVLTFAPNPVDGKRPKRPRCATWRAARWTTL